LDTLSSLRAVFFAPAQLSRYLLIKTGRAVD